MTPVAASMNWASREVGLPLVKLALPETSALITGPGPGKQRRSPPGTGKSRW